MRMADIIEHKKQGLALTKEEIDFFVKSRTARIYYRKQLIYTHRQQHGRSCGKRYENLFKIKAFFEARFFHL